MIRRLLCISALALGVLATSVPAAGAATVSPDKFAPKFCSTLSGYSDTLTKGANDLSSSLSGTTDLKKARAKLVAFLGKMQTAAKTAESKMKAAGVSSSANGAKISAAFVSALGKSADVFGAAKANAAKVSTSNPSAFEKQGAKVGSDLQAAADKLTSGFSNISSLDTKGELAAALQAEPGCSFLASSGSSSS